MLQLLDDIEDPLQASQPLILVGLLVNYDKFETHNHYRPRFAETTDDGTLHAVIATIGQISFLLRDRYVAVLDDIPAAWSIGGTLSYVGLGALAGAKSAAPVMTEEQQKTLFDEQ